MSASRPRRSSNEAKARRAALKRRTLKKHAEARIDEFLRSVGVKDPSEFTDEHGWRHLDYGSAEGFAFVDDEDNEVTFHVAATVMTLPSDKDLVVPLMRDVLEHNSMLWGAPHFSIVGSCLYASAGHQVRSMKDEDYGDYIHGVMTLADATGRRLLKKYGGTTRKRAGRSSRS